MSPHRTIGVALDPARPDVGTQALWRGICRYARDHDWQVVLDPFADRAPAARYDGLILHGNLGKNRGRPTVPTVLLTPNRQRRRLSQVTPDYYEMGRLAARHLIKRDYTQFAAFGRNYDFAAWMRLETFRTTVRRKATHLDSMLFGRHGPHTARTWRRFSAVLDRWFAKARLPVGIFATSDQLARHLADACARAGLRIPDDVAIVGSGNDLDVCEALDPTLTSVDPDYEAVGARAAATLDEVLDAGGGLAIRRRIPPVGVVTRTSTNRGFFDDPAVTAALAWIARHCHEPIRVDHVAKGVGVAPWKLRKLMREARRHSLVHAIAHARLRRAMSLLESTDFRVETVAKRAGYASVHALGTAFREHLHMHPTAYRRAAAEGTLPPSAPIEHARRLLRESTWSVARIALVTGYATEIRLQKAFRRHFGTTPGLWRSVHGRPSARNVAANPNPPWPRDVNVTFHGPDGKEMEEE